MPSLIDIRRRVRSVRNTQQITKAMKMVSAAKLRRAQERALAARPEKRVLVVVVTADRGLAGGFNANLLKLAQRFVDGNRDKELTFELVGRKGRDYFRKRGATIAGEYIGWMRTLSLADAQRIAG